MENPFKCYLLSGRMPLSFWYRVHSSQHLAVTTSPQDEDVVSMEKTILEEMCVWNYFGTVRSPKTGPIVPQHYSTQDFSPYFSKAPNVYDTRRLCRIPDGGPWQNSNFLVNSPVSDGLQGYWPKLIQDWRLAKKEDAWQVKNNPYVRKLLQNKDHIMTTHGGPPLSQEESMSEGSRPE